MSMWEEFKKDKRQWNDEKDQRAVNEEYEYSYKRNPDYMKDPLMKFPEYKESVEAEEQFTTDMKDFDDSFINQQDESVYENEKPRVRTRNRVGSSIIVAILVTAIVTTAGILTAILLLK